MKITIVGLGLIGGSLAKTIKKHTNHTVNGIDTNPETIKLALSQGAIDTNIDDTTLADITFVCLYPEATVSYILGNNFKGASIVSDVCGVKGYIVENVDKTLHERGVNFVGTHPMAGREFSGYEYALDTLFDTASMIITPTELTSKKCANIIEDLAYAMQFKKVVRATPAEHDDIIAYSSQLAHIVSSAYIKSPTHLRQLGFSAGSFLDLTRVAKLNEDMWTPLFLANKKALSNEITEIINHLTEYKNCLDTDNFNELHDLLRTGRILKEETVVI
ncbi:MAG: prephenate dehydrogenase/arogenate dehydrogenase family protein [Ruminococcus sp.]|jgi:prephenate dehydrogenase|nr:prephenate dehydrogenase/arogenate dehydrogenase family protein [Ruminococcus sp.]